MRARLFGMTLVATLIVGSAPARAQDAQKPDFAAAKRHFKTGQELLRIDRYAEAIVEFKKAYEITKDGLVMGQVAEAYAKAGDYENALVAIKTYRESLPEGERASADALIKDYEKAIKDGRSKHLTLPGETVEPPPQTKPAEPTPPPPTTPEEPPRKTRRLWTWVAAGAAGALAISALVLGLNAQSKYDELADQCKPSCFGRESDIDSIRSRAIATDVLWGVAAAAAVTSVVLFFVEGRAIKRDRDKLDPTGGDTEEEARNRRFRFTPVVGGGRYGVGAGVQF